MAGSTKRNVLVVIALIAIAFVIWFVLFRGKMQSDASKPQDLPVQVVKQSVAPTANVAAEPAEMPAIVPVVPAAETATKVSPNLDVPPMDLISGEIEAETNVFTQRHIKRIRPIAINAGFLDKDNGLAPGSRLNLQLFPDVNYAVTLQMVKRGQQGSISASGTLDGEEYGTFSLSMAGGVTLMKLADPVARRLFLIRCHGPDRIHYVVEIDPEKVSPTKQGVPESALNTTAIE